MKTHGFSPSQTWLDAAKEDNGHIYGPRPYGPSNFVQGETGVLQIRRGRPGRKLTEDSDPIGPIQDVDGLFTFVTGAQLNDGQVSQSDMIPIQGTVGVGKIPHYIVQDLYLIISATNGIVALKQNSTKSGKVRAKS